MQTKIAAGCLGFFLFLGCWISVGFSNKSPLETVFAFFLGAAGIILVLCAFVCHPEGARDTAVNSKVKEKSEPVLMNSNTKKPWLAIAIDIITKCLLGLLAVGGVFAVIFAKHSPGEKLVLGVIILGAVFLGGFIFMQWIGFGSGGNGSKKELKVKDEDGKITTYIEKDVQE